MGTLIWGRMEEVVKHLTPGRLVAFDKHFLSFLIALITMSTSTLAMFVLPSPSTPQLSSLTGCTAENSSLLECLQVGPPVLNQAQACQQTLMVHTFALSYGEPFVGES